MDQKINAVIQRRCLIGRVHFCKTHSPPLRIANPLKRPISFLICLVFATIFFPVAWIAPAPLILGVDLVFLVVRVGLHLLALPLRLSGALACRLTAMGLVFDARVWITNRFFAMTAQRFGFHGVPPWNPYSFIALRKVKESDPKKIYFEMFWGSKWTGVKVGYLRRPLVGTQKAAILG